jgi:hypothetical protein
LRFDGDYLYSVAMAKKTVFVDDLDGSEDGVRTIDFALEGVSYSIDLGERNADKLHTTLSKYIDHAARVSGSPRRSRSQSRAAAPVKTNRERIQAIREWARDNGYEVSDRGRISLAVQEAYDNAH